MHNLATAIVVLVAFLFMSDPRKNVPKHLVEINLIANQIGIKLFRQKDTCVVMATALSKSLEELGYKSKVARVTFAVFPDKTRCGTVLGSDEGRSRKSRRGMWSGHLAALVDDKWLLDPTADQVQLDGISIPPLAIELESIDPFHSTQFEAFSCHLRYNLYRRGQVGFKDAPDSRQSHWSPVKYCIVREAKERGLAI